MLAACANQNTDNEPTPLPAATTTVGVGPAVQVSFVESAPKDRFTITTDGACALPELTVAFDLSQSAGKLIFDTTSTGAGVEVFQPFEVVSGEIFQAGDSNVSDGDSQLKLRITNLAPDGTASFTIDVDDTLTDGELGQIRVAGTEISGGLVTITAGNLPAASATFDDSSLATINLPACP